MGQKAKNAGKKNSKICYKIADSVSQCPTGGRLVRVRQKNDEYITKITPRMKKMMGEGKNMVLKYILD